MSKIKEWLMELEEQANDRLQDGCRVYLEPWELDAEYDYINDQFDAIFSISEKYFSPQ